MYASNSFASWSADKVPEFVPDVAQAPMPLAHIGDGKR
jgi:hypothetical protein